MGGGGGGSEIYLREIEGGLNLQSLRSPVEWLAVLQLLLSTR